MTALLFEIHLMSSARSAGTPFWSARLQDQPCLILKERSRLCCGRCGALAANVHFLRVSLTSWPLSLPRPFRFPRLVPPGCKNVPLLCARASKFESRGNLQTHGAQGQPGESYKHLLREISVGFRSFRDPDGAVGQAMRAARHMLRVRCSPESSRSSSS